MRQHLAAAGGVFSESSAWRTARLDADPGLTEPRASFPGASPGRSRQLAGGHPAAPPVSLKHPGAVVCYIPEGQL